MRTRDPQRLILFCAGCGKTSTFVLIGGKYVCAGDEKKKRMGCGRVIEKE